MLSRLLTYIGNACIVLQFGGVVRLILEHKFIAALVCWLLFSAMVDGMPSPDAGSGFAYRWLYGSLNLFAANTTRMLCALSPRFTTLFGNTPKAPGTKGE